MNNIERRALYNLLRMNWLNEPSLPVEPWQVEDYRTLSLPILFNRLKNFNIHLDRTSFIAYADECDSPEDLTDHLVADSTFSAPEEDQIYLIIFEIWRQLMNEKPSLSIVCSELDYQIHLYDQQQLDNPLALQDAITHFAHILDENADQGVPPEQVLTLISSYCANDIETFLYDFISEQIDEDNDTYAHELLDDFEIYLTNNKWFKLLRIRLCDHNKIMQKLIEDVTEEHLNDQDLGYHLELLSILADKGIDSLFRFTFKQTLPLIKREEDFQDLLVIAIDYFHQLDKEQQEMALKTILEKHLLFSPEKTVNPDDADLITLESTLLS